VSAAAGLRHRIIDIVLRKAEELAQLAAELRRSNEELEAFSYSVSHDLRAPFRHIVGFSELLVEEESHRLSDAGRHYLQAVREAGTYAGTLVDHLLNFSRMSRTPLEPVDVDLGELVREEWADAVASESPGRDLTLDAGRLPTVRADLILLRLAVRNLLLNAVKYTRPRPQARVEVRGWETEREAVFFVKDNGVGFDTQYVGKTPSGRGRSP
jgi:light-regulated signal transduction histidine kinase (bacteriophytochrome)